MKQKKISVLRQLNSNSEYEILDIFDSSIDITNSTISKESGED